MSIRLILDLSKAKLSITPAQKFVLHCLAFYTNDDKDGLCYPSYHTISEFTGYSRRGVIKIIDQLCFMRLLTKEVDNNKSNRYRITLPGSEPSSPALVNPVHHTSEPSSPNLINDLIINLKENIKRKDEQPENSVPEKASSSVLLDTAKRLIDFLRKKTGRNYQHKPTTLKHILQRLKEGATEIQCKQVILRKHRDWAHLKDMEKYIRPSTLFSKTNFWDKYLPECVSDIEKKEIMEKG